MSAFNELRRSYGIAEVSAMGGWSVTTTFKLIREGKLPAKKLGNRTIILAEDLDAFLKNLNDA